MVRLLTLLMRRNQGISDIWSQRTTGIDLISNVSTWRHAPVGSLCPHVETSHAFSWDDDGGGMIRDVDAWKALGCYCNYRGTLAVGF